jgi:uncharacterized protein YoxC
MARTLSEITSQLKALLGEAKVTSVDPVAPIASVPGIPAAPIASDVLVTAANEWRKYVRRGDAFLEGVQKVVTAADSLAAAKEVQDKRRSVSDVSTAVQKVAGTLASAYEEFKLGREQMYQAAKLWHISTKRSSNLPPSKDISSDDDSKLIAAIDKGAKGMMSASRKMLDEGAKSSGMLRAAAKLAAPMGIPANAEDIISTCLNFRDLVSEAAFARAKGILRRAVMLSNRTWEEMKFESAIAPAGKLDWTCPWDDDPEFGGREVV